MLTKTDSPEEPNFMLKIFGRPNSINVQKVMWAANELGLQYEHETAGMAFGKVNEDWYRAMNPNSLVPTIDDDGVVLWESNVIVRYLAAKHSAGQMMPEGDAERADAEMWMDWQQTAIHPPMTPVFWNLIRTPESERNMKSVETNGDKVRDALARLNARLVDRTFVCGDQLTVADIPLGCVVYRWFALPVEHGDIPNVRAWYERLTERAAYREHVMLPVT
ncbi:MAG: glutathione S-transferase [Hyphomicrobiaceae bacterium]